jgi:hypothetical protein
MSISGSKGGMLSSYALSVLVLHVFSTHEFRPSSSNDIGDVEKIEKASDPLLRVHPLDVLRAFLKIFSSFQWESFVVTLDGPAVIKTGNLSTPNLESTGAGKAAACSLSCSHVTSFGPLLRVAAMKVHDAAAMHRTEVEVSAAAAGGTPNVFPVRCCNILDPVDSVNNLGVPVSWRNLKIIKTALDGGSQHLEAMLSAHFVPRNLQPAVSRHKGSISPSLAALDASSVLGTPHSGIAPGLSLPPRPPAHLASSSPGQPPLPPGPPPVSSSSVLPIAPTISASSFASLSSCLPPISHQSSGVAPLQGVIADQWMTQQPAQLSYASVTAPVQSTVSPQDRGVVTPSMAFVRNFFSACFNAYHIDSLPPISLRADKHATIMRNPISSTEFGVNGGGIARQRAHSYSTVTTLSSNGSSSSESSPESASNKPMTLAGDIDSMWSSLVHTPVLLMDDDSIFSSQQEASTPGKAYRPSQYGAISVDVDCVNDASTDGEHHSPLGSASCSSVAASAGGVDLDVDGDLVLDDDDHITQSSNSSRRCDASDLSHEASRSPDGRKRAQEMDLLHRNSRSSSSHNDKVENISSRCSQNIQGVFPSNKAKRKKGVRGGAAATTTHSATSEDRKRENVRKSGMPTKVDGDSATTADGNVSSDDGERATSYTTTLPIYYDSLFVSLVMLNLQISL